VYRTIEDLQRLIEYSGSHKGTNGVVVGGGLLGLEAAKAMMDLEAFEKVCLIERNRWVLSRQLDGDAGGLVVEQVRALGLEVLLSKRVGKIEVNENRTVKGVLYALLLVSRPGTSWQGRLESNVLTEVVELSLKQTCAQASRISTLLASVQAGRTKPLD